MKRLKVTLTYVAEVDDELLQADYVHENLEDYISQEFRMNIYDDLGEDSWIVPLKLQQYQTNIGRQKIVTVQKT